MTDQEIAKFLLSLQIWHDQQVAQPQRDPDFHVRAAKKLGEVRTYIRRLENQGLVSRGDAAQLVPSDIEGLPEELRQELAISEAEQFELDVLKIIEAAGGKISLELLLIQWYRTKGETIKRRTMTSRIYRLLNKNRLYSTPGLKGVYQLAKPADHVKETADNEDD